jgi:hypothetical protein
MGLDALNRRLDGLHKVVCARSSDNLWIIEHLPEELLAQEMNEVRKPVANDRDANAGCVVHLKLKGLEGIVDYRQTTVKPKPH